MQKVKITQKDFDELYEIDEGITEETEVKTDEPILDKQDTTPESILTEAEQTIDDQFFDSLQVEDEM